MEAYLRAGNEPAGPYTRFLAARGLLETHLGLYGRRIAEKERLEYPLVSGLPDDAYEDTWIADRAVRVLRAFEAGRPWHLAVNFAGPHDPFDATESMWRDWAERPVPAPAGRVDDRQDQWELKRRGYGADIENIDRLAGRILAAVAARGEAERTLVVYSSDHGEMLGDHDAWGKRRWHAPSVGVPLVVSGAGVGGRGESTALVELHDLAATFLDYAGAEPLPDSDALSVRPVLTGEARNHRKVAESAFGAWRMVFDGRYKLVDEGAGKPTRLFDTLTDPHELRDVSQEHPDVVHGLSEHATGGRTNGES